MQYQLQTIAALPRKQISALLKESLTTPFFISLIVFPYSLQAASNSDTEPLNCDTDEVAAYMVDYDRFRQTLVGDIPNLKGHEITIATADQIYAERKGQMLDIPSMFQGKTVYTPYKHQKWETLNRVYTYTSHNDIASVRGHSVVGKSSLPYALPDTTENVKRFAGYDCEWVSQSVDGFQQIDLCNALFYGWTVALYSRILTEGKETDFSEATKISHQCVEKERLAIPLSYSWKQHQ